MSTRMVFTGLFQYASVQEALGAAQWLDTWMKINYGSIHPAGSGYSVDALIPPVTDTAADPAANGQLTWTIHLEGADTQSVIELANTVSPISDGTVLATIQNSTQGCTPE